MTHHLVTEAHPVRTHLHFDFDGVLADTEEHFPTYWVEMAKNIIKERFRPDLSLESIHDKLYEGHRLNGCSVLGASILLGLPKDWPDEFYAKESVDVAKTHSHLLTQRPHLVSYLEKAFQMAHLRVLTQAHADYASHILTHLNMRSYFPLLRHRAYKRTAEPFQQILAEEGHLEAHHWLIEDSPANLPMAKRYGFTTVLVGGRKGEADYHFATVEDFLHAFITNGLTAK